MNEKLISFIIPCYNSEEYLDVCVKSIVDGAKKFINEVEILLINDGSSDGTDLAIDAWQKQYPKTIKVIHQKNKGHGGAINTGIKNTTGDYVKVVDSDDWLDKTNLPKLLATLKKLRKKKLDMLVSNYVYDGKSHKSMSYERNLPTGKIITWDEIGRFGPSKYILMHSVIFRSEILRQMKLKLPEHTFYVDNIFVYTVLPNVKTLYYENLDIYHYFIGRDDQSVNEKVMTSRFDQQLKINKILIDAVNFDDEKIPSKLLEYLANYLSMMMTISSLFCILACKQSQKNELWEYLEKKNPEAYKKVKKTIIGRISSKRNKISQKLFVFGYRIVRRIWRVN